MNGYIKLGIAALLPVALAVVLYVIQKTEKFKKCPYAVKQIIIGILFGGLAIVGTEWGIPVNGATANCRDAAVLCAGLLYGGPAGIIAGFIGGIERWIAVAWGVGSFTRVACTLSTIIAGFYAAGLRKYMFDQKKPGVVMSLFIGFVMEVFHLTMVFVTNLGEPIKGATVVKACALPMIISNGISVMLATLFVTLISTEGVLVKHEKAKISQTIQRWLLGSVFIAFAITTAFVWILQNGIEKNQAESFVTKEDALLTKDVVLYANSFMEILVFAALFAIIYFLIKKVVVNKISSINNSLAKITQGDLQETVDVRDNEEFASLSDDINETVDTLKKYIDEAAARIDKELEFARAIQASALPSIFPAFPSRKDFDIYARMDTAKEVGGDFYDFYMNQEDLIHVLIADVSGKGIPAAMFMMRAKTQLKSLTESGIGIEDVFTRGNEGLCEGNDAGMFVTAWQGSINLETGLVSFTNGGHNPPLICRKGEGFSYLRSKAGLVLAGMEGIQYIRQEVKLEPGDILYLYTDGVTEATNINNELYGEDRLLNTLNNGKYTDMKSLCDMVKDDVDKFVGEAPQFDDITMVAFQYNGKPKIYNQEFKECSLDDIPKIQAGIEEELEKLGAPMKVAIQMDVAIDEIYSNIVKFAYNGKPGWAMVSLEPLQNANGVLLCFADNGVPYNPLTKENPDLTLSVEEREIGGLGIYMVKETMDEMRYEYIEDNNVLKLIKKW